MTGHGPKANGAYQLTDNGAWVYRKLQARELWDKIMPLTYTATRSWCAVSGPHINRDNNLSYCETIASTNPCARQPLPPYGCCCLSSIDLTRFIDHPFENARFRHVRLR